jgi:hypothetical protein
MHTKEWLHLRVTSHTSHIQNTQKGLKHNLCIQKNGYIYVLQVTLAIQKIHKKDYPSLTLLRLKRRA